MIDLSGLTQDQLIERFTPVTDVARQIADARRSHSPYSFVRLGDGENAALAPLLGEEYRELAWVAQGDHRYCGLVPLNGDALPELVHAIRHADMVGMLYQDENKWHRPMTERIFRAAHLRPKRITYAFNNLALAEQLEFLEVLKESRVAIVGRLSESLADFLATAGVHVTARLMLGWYPDVHPVLDHLATADYDICLAACGVNAVIVCQQIAERHGKIGIDFGSAATCLVHGSLRLHPG